MNEKLTEEQVIVQAVRSGNDPSRALNDWRRRDFPATVEAEEYEPVGRGGLDPYGSGPYDAYDPVAEAQRHGRRARRALGDSR